MLCSGFFNSYLLKHPQSDVLASMIQIYEFIYNIEVAPCYDSIKQSKADVSAGKESKLIHVDTTAHACRDVLRLSDSLRES